MSSGDTSRRWRGPIGAVLVLAAAGTTAWFATRTPAATPTADGHVHGVAASGDGAAAVILDSASARRIGVTFATAEAGPLLREIRSVGLVTYDEARVRTVSLKFDGWIETLHVDVTGQAVRAGQPLLETYSPMLASAEEELLLAVQLLRDVRGGDQETLRGAERPLRGARDRLRNWDVPAAETARVEESGVSGRTLAIHAPYDGVVIEKLVTEGQRVMAGDPLYRLADLSRVWVEGEVFEQDLAALRLGQEVSVELDALPGRPRRGRIDFLQPTVASETRSLRVRVELQNADGSLRPGMFATILVRAPESRSVVQVPRSALLSTGERDVVFVRGSDGALTPRAVVRGRASDDRVEILSGLAAGEVVVASATFLVDAESNLGAAMAGMAGMDTKASPPAKASIQPAPPAAHDH